MICNNITINKNNLSPQKYSLCKNKATHFLIHKTIDYTVVCCDYCFNSKIIPHEFVQVNSEKEYIKYNKTRILR